MSRRKKKDIVVNTDAQSTIKAIEFPDKEFSSKAELFKALKSNEEKIISLKTATIKDSESVSFEFGTEKNETIKGLHNLPAGKVAAIINTTNYIDSHNDVHLPKIWNKSVKEQKGKIYYVADHELKLSSVIAFPKDVNMNVQDISWKDLGEDMPGITQALVFEVSIDAIKNDFAKGVIEEKQPIEHSVRMQYIKMFLALNSDAKEDKEHKKKFDKYIDEIANKDTALDNGYFWGVTEAKVFKEGSMVLFGSNDATPLLYPKENVEPSKDTLSVEPSEDTQIDEVIETKVKRRRR